VTWSRAIASGFGTGFAPVAPGTAGSVLGVLGGAALLHASWWALLAATMLAAVGGLFAIGAATSLPLRASASGHMDDPGWITIDEIAGQCCALLFLPRPTLAGAALAFAAFRMFDISKPGPIGWADRQGGAGGIMLDDIIAGLAAGVIVLLAHMLAPRFV
jgi:phosphatidylglycerophosphatase A